MLSTGIKLENIFFFFSHKTSNHGLFNTQWYPQWGTGNFELDRTSGDTGDFEQDGTSGSSRFMQTFSSKS